MIKLNINIKSYFGEDNIGYWESNVYRVIAFYDVDVIRLDVERKDGLDGIKWDELQQIKHDCGFGKFDALEFYPCDDDVINTGNWRHLYISLRKLPIIRRK